LIIVNDGSHMNYEWIKDYLKRHFEYPVWHDMEPYEAFRIDGGFNNPSRAFNQGVKLATGDSLFLMSSDVQVTPRAIAKARRVNTGEMIWTPYVEDTDGNPPLLGEYVGPRRLFPMPWFLGVCRQHLLDVGGWDETYLLGMCYEDNDVVGRLALRAGRFVGDWSVKVYHRSHLQNAYMYQLGDGSELAQANERNRAYTMDKWGGIPFDMEFTPFDVHRKMHPSGEVCHECVERTNKLDKVVAMTKGLLAVDKVDA